MKIPKIYTIQATGVWESIPTIQDQEGFIFRPDTDIEFSDSNSPSVDEIIPVVAGKQNKFNKPTSFWIRGTAGTQLFIAPFDGVISNDGTAPTTSADFVSQVTLIAGVDKVVSHNLGRQNMHITVLQGDEPIAISVSDITETEITLSSLNSGNYILLLTKLDTTYGSNFGIISGVNRADIVNFETMKIISSIDMGGDTLAGGLFIDNFYFVINKTTGFLHKKNIYTGVDEIAPIQVSIGGTPGAIFTDYKYIYIIDSALDRVTKFDIAGNSVVGFITTNDYPAGGDIDLTAGVLYVSCYDLVGGSGAGGFHRIDLSTFAITNTITSIPNCRGVAFDSSYIYVADYTFGIIHRIDKTTQLDVGNVNTSTFASGILKVFENKLYIGGYGTGKILELDLLVFTAGALQTLIISGDAYCFEISRRKLLFGSYSNDYLGEVDIDTFTYTLRTLAVVNNPTRIQNFN